MVYDICVIGHITKDITWFVDQKGNEKDSTLFSLEKSQSQKGDSASTPGGTAFYAPLALKSMGLDVCVVTKMAKQDERSLLKELRASHIAITCSHCEKTTTFENIYQADNLDMRRQRVDSLAAAFCSNDFNHISAKVVYVGSLTREEFPKKLFLTVAKKAKEIVLDVQGFLRVIQETCVVNTPWPEAGEILKYVTILKASEGEASLLSGEKDLKEAARKIARFGVREVVITMGSRGSMILFENQLFHIPPHTPKKIVDPTGCGDTYLAGYVGGRLLGKDPKTAAEIGSELAAKKIESFGVIQERGLRSILGI